VASGFSRKTEDLLIVRLGSLGDIIHTIPAAAALRVAFPGARIDWLTAPEYVDLLGLVEGLDGRIAIDTRAILGGPHGVIGTIGRLRRARYDAVLDMQGLLKSAVVARLAGASRTVGFTRDHLREPAAAAFYSETVNPSGAAHVIQKHLALTHALGVDDTAIRFPLRIPDAPAVAALTARIGEPGFVLLNPGAAWPNKRWDPARFGALAAALAHRRGLRSVVMWGPSERELADAVVNASQGAAELAPRTRIVDLFALARAARLMISGDTGPMHIAGAVGTPIVGLFGPTSAQRNGPWAADDQTISRLDQCQCVYERRCRLSNMCINDIQVDDVVRAADERLTRHRA
jgi:lipopolysaccharide heptosyltransferase I